MRTGDVAARFLRATLLLGPPGAGVGRTPTLRQPHYHRVETRFRQPAPHILGIAAFAEGADAHPVPAVDGQQLDVGVLVFEAALDLDGVGLFAEGADLDGVARGADQMIVEENSGIDTRTHPGVDSILQLKTAELVRDGELNETNWEIALGYPILVIPFLSSIHAFLIPGLLMFLGVIYCHGSGGVALYRASA